MIWPDHSIWRPASFPGADLDFERDKQFFAAYLQMIINCIIPWRSLVPASPGTAVGDGKRRDVPMRSKDDAPLPSAQTRLPAQEGRPQTAVRLLTTAELFVGNNEVMIDHDGERYRLRRTSKGKLILTK